MIVSFYFSARKRNSYLTIGNLIFLTVSIFLISYAVAIPFYLLFEKPFANIFNLILFPPKAIFQKKKDLEDDSLSENEEEGPGAKNKTE
mmetsp:Transcript_38631/g.36987  ORF Transcript_38631/g.36987 Transcript_38631/m.36987 type:complete len:89 (-) Transcript_38631:512-778(-)|eukprot:CAMPEP_0170559096 /NCGR_PEP_ID=MMETSP0211-20121228/40038_1 /TAXON_ID=311385 /ORGANISM="Pseudokeronopsis sp., Strain OXSARD2" /LENGTH=88 /DNA_ID=CAMNT_0010871723 /DNA_START=1833 /DNA_END=2099 /DNA_ORIENTATION=+